MLTWQGNRTWNFLDTPRESYAPHSGRRSPVCSLCDHFRAPIAIVDCENGLPPRMFDDEALLRIDAQQLLRRVCPDVCATCADMAEAGGRTERAVQSEPISVAEHEQAKAIAAERYLPVSPLAGGWIDPGHGERNPGTVLRPRHRGHAGAAEDPPSAVGATVQQHLEEGGQIGGRRGGTVSAPVRLVELRGIDASIPRTRRRREGKPVSPIDAPCAESGRQDELTVMHAERLEQPRPDELPEGHAAHAAHDVAQEHVADPGIAEG